MAENTIVLRSCLIPQKWWLMMILGVNDDSWYAGVLAQVYRTCVRENIVRVSVSVWESKKQDRAQSNGCSVFPENVFFELYIIPGSIS